MRRHRHTPSRLPLRQIHLQSRYFRLEVGQRTPWYIFGLVTILICFAPIFSSYHHPQVHWEYLYYSVFPGLFNIGWACLQISHMSMAPSLTCSRKRRVFIPLSRINSTTAETASAFSQTLSCLSPDWPSLPS